MTQRHKPHAYQHNHQYLTNKKALLLSFILITSYMLVEFIGGIYSNSLALLSDAGHMLNDCVALGLSLLAIFVSEMSANKKQTYGYKRIEILVALLNGITLLLVAIIILYHAYLRIANPPEILAIDVLIIASIGLIINLLVAWLLHKGDKHNLNLQSAFWHVLADLLGSVAAIISAILIMLFNWHLADIVVSALVSLLILHGGYKIIKQASNILIETKPVHINSEQIKQFFLQQANVIAVNDLHIWEISSGYAILTAHLQVSTNCQQDALLATLEQYLTSQQYIKHSTIQLETNFKHSHCH